MKKNTLLNLLTLLTVILFKVTFSTAQNSPNIIFLIGDGMGLSQITSGMYANDNKTALENFEFIGLSKTHSANKLVTDSAASGTAMATGQKTYNGVLGINPANVRFKSILEICQEKNYQTALISTSSIVHATPASFYAKNISRYNYEDIALQLSKHSIDIFVGGGMKYFNSRKDERNLIREMKSYSFVKNIKQLEKSNSKKIGYLTYAAEPPKASEKRTPLLKDITKAVLNKLDSKKTPFFIMIEGSQIDWAGHDNDLNYIISEFIDFDGAIQVALDFAKADGNTLVVVTADHETGGLGIKGGSISRNKVSGGFVTGGHTGTMVPVFSYGPNSDVFSGIYDNTKIFDKFVKSIK
tara:strand:- start:5493 stop:6554 length:1062 start_codon:yes stop_codon:yes gene_type:complete